MGENNSITSQFPLETVNVSDLKPHPRNYLKHPQDELEHIKASIQEHGLYKNIVIARDGTILAGHGVWEAVKQLEWSVIPVIRLPIDPDSPGALKLLTGDNEISHLREIDNRVLTDILKEIKQSDINGLLGTGYDEMMLSNLLFITRTRSEIQNFDEAAEWIGMPEYNSGLKVLQIIINFTNEQDRTEFIQRTGLKCTKSGSLNNWSAWYPNHEKQDISSLKIIG